MTTIETFAPAKINLTLHVTGQRADGYHLLDSLVAFADIGDRLQISPALDTALTVTGPMAQGVPVDPSNLCWRAADLTGMTVTIGLEKHLPAAAGIGGGSSDAAAVLRGIEQMTGRAPDIDPLTLGADVPVCLLAQTARMSGIGEEIRPLKMPEFAAILVNPGVGVPTGPVFKALTNKHNPPMTAMPESCDQRDWLAWLHDQRNDLEAPACAVQPVVGDVLAALHALDGVGLARMSGSGATCVALFENSAQAASQAQKLRQRHPGWWVQSCVIGGASGADVGARIGSGSGAKKAPCGFM